jgi:hypothetical protein
MSHDLLAQVNARLSDDPLMVIVITIHRGFMGQYQDLFMAAVE